MFNLSGSELVFLVLIALVVLGPDKLPEAMRKAGKAYADFKKMTSGFQSEMRSVLDEPMRELRETAELAKKAASWDTDMFGSQAGQAKPVSGSMADHTPAPAATTAPTTPTAADTPADEADRSADATTRRLHAQAAADLANSIQAGAPTATSEPPTAVDGEAAVVEAPKPFSPNFSSAAPRVSPPVAMETPPAAGGDLDSDEVVAE